MIVWVIFFAVFALIGWVGWWISIIGTQAILYYMKNKGYKMPDKKEIKKYSKYAARKEFGLPTDMSD